VQPFGPETHALLGELVPVVRRRLDDMTARVVDALVPGEPGYDGLVAASADELRATVRLCLERGLTGLLGVSRRSGVGSVAGAREVGRRRATQGVPLEAVLRAFRLAGQVTWEELLTAARAQHREQDPLLLEVAGSLWRSNDVQCAAVAEGYREEQRRTAAAEEGARQRLLDGLLDGRGGDPAFVREAAELLCLPLGGRLTVVVAPPDAAGEPTLTDPGPELLRRGVRSVWGARSGAQVGVVAVGAAGERDLPRWLESLARGPVGVSGVVEGAAAVASAYRLAETAARTLPAGVRQVVAIDERLPEALLADSPEISRRLIRQSFGRLVELPDDEREVLLETLSAFLAADGSATRAADALYCHRNTVMHRLRRIESVTGRKLTDPRSRLLWQLALLGTEHRGPAQRSA
jgi:hypothetical protein